MRINALTSFDFVSELTFISQNVMINCIALHYYESIIQYNAGKKYLNIH